ncbi:MAG: lamin tail domain-containing protein [Myxococcaceae bacterium]|nr:lamin tail domain-containing protein [Myxococcaceae bacterium]
MPGFRFGLSLLTATALFSCVSGKQPSAPAPPVIQTFSVDRATLHAGEQVTLSWQTSGTDTLTLVDPSGTETALTPAASGSLTVSPTQTTFYLLRASGPGGKDSAFLQVAVDQPLSEVFLVAIPNEIDAGQTAELVWSAFGASTVSLKAADGTVVPVSGQSGVAHVKPTHGTTYTLTAGALNATATVKVRPVLLSFTATPAVAKSGDTIKLEWATAGFDSLAIAEATFGAIGGASGDATQNGSAMFTVPELLPGADGGMSTVPNGFPLAFTLTASTASPAFSVQQTVNGAVGEGATITEFKVPANGTLGRPVPLSWATQNAVRVELLADGDPLYRPPAGTQTSGSFVLPGLRADTVVTLVAYDFKGFQVRAEKKVSLLQPPQALTFTGQASASSVASGAQVAWTTQHTALVVIRVKNGPTVFSTRATASLASGNTLLFPARDTTFVLEAYNEAGEVATLEKTIAVAMPVTATITPEPVVSGTTVNFAWDLSGTQALDVVGLPNAMAPVPTAATSFVDLTQTPGTQGVAFADKNDGTALIQPGEGFRFPFLNKVYGSFTASTNGFLALAPMTASPANLTFAMYTGAPMLAPFWDDLNLEDGSMLWLVEGDAFPRRLIVQWNKAHIHGDPTSELTFQVQLFETGEARFVFHTLRGAAALGQNATLGIFGGTDMWNSQYSFNPGVAAIAENQELTWFTGGAPTGMQSIKVANALTAGFFFKTAGSNWAYVNSPVRVFTSSTVQLTEVMPVAPTGADKGRWVELYNPGLEPLDISGLMLSTGSAPDAGYTFPSGTVIGPNSYWVAGESTDAIENGEAGVKLAWNMGDVPLASDDTVALRVPLSSPVTISSLAWMGAPAGISYQREVGIGPMGALTCTRKSMFGPLGATGTPGAQNETCFEYSLSAIPFAYEDISAGGLQLFAPPLSLDDEITTVPLAKPFTYFGSAYSVMTVSTNGWAGFGTYTSSFAGNKVVPSATNTPLGTVAPFWDDLANSGSYPDANVYYARSGDHFIVQWHHYSFWSTPRSDDLNVQAKFFDDGSIEFHYAEMLSRPGSSVATGQTATAWIERPTGTAAAPISINSAGLSPHSAWRFTPKP